MTLSLISYSQTYLPLIFKILFSHLASNHSVQDEKIQIKDETFDTKEALIGHVRTILQQTTINANQEKPFWRLVKQDEAFMLEFFKHHHNADEKLDSQEGVYIGVSAQATRCFFLKKGEQFHEISYLKTVDNLYAKQRFHYEIPSEDQQRYTFII